LNNIFLKIYEPPEKKHKKTVKVERSQKKDKEEFYPTLDTDKDDLQEKFDEWQHYYNWFRPHGAHNGRTPMDKYSELSEKTPFWDEVHKNYHPEKETNFLLF